MYNNIQSLVAYYTTFMVLKNSNCRQGPRPRTNSTITPLRSMAMHEHLKL